jgi:glycosyltransferase involved in cell wall biosynthesis
MSLRICLISDGYPPENAGSGITTYTATTARALVQDGHQVSVIAPAVEGAASVSERSGVQLRRVLAARLPGSGGKSFLDSYLFARAAAAEVHKIMRQNGLDVIESPEHGAAGFALAMNGARRPHVVRLHTPLFLANEAAGRRLSAGGRVVHAMERTTTRRAALVTSPSLALGQAIAPRFGIDAARIRVVPNSIDTEAFQPATESVPHAPTVLYVGKILVWKGVFILTEAIPRIINRIPDARVVFVGSDHPAGNGLGSTKQEMLAQFQHAGVASRVTILDRVERSELIALYHQADVSVVPSLWEGFGYTCLEAMSCGLAVVATAVGGLSEIIDQGRDGVLVPPSDPVKLADAIVELLVHAERRRALGQAARGKALRVYSVERVMQQTVAAYDEAIALAGAGGGACSR